MAVKIMQKLRQLIARFLTRQRMSGLSNVSEYFPVKIVSLSMSHRFRSQLSQWEWSCESYKLSGLSEAYNTLSYDATSDDSESNMQKSLSNSETQDLIREDHKLCRSKCNNLTCDINQNLLKFWHLEAFITFKLNNKKSSSIASSNIRLITLSSRRWEKEGKVLRQCQSR